MTYQKYPCFPFSSFCSRVFDVHILNLAKWFQWSREGFFKMVWDACISFQVSESALLSTRHENQQQDLSCLEGFFWSWAAHRRWHIDPSSGHEAATLTECNMLGVQEGWLCSMQPWSGSISCHCTGCTIATREGQFILVIFVSLVLQLMLLKHSTEEHHLSCSQGHVALGAVQRKNIFHLGEGLCQTLKNNRKKIELTIACYQVTLCCLLLQNLSRGAGGGDLGHAQAQEDWNESSSALDPVNWGILLPLPHGLSAVCCPH